MKKLRFLLFAIFGLSALMAKSQCFFGPSYDTAIIVNGKHFSDTILQYDRCKFLPFKPDTLYMCPGQIANVNFSGATSVTFGVGFPIYGWDTTINNTVNIDLTRWSNSLFIARFLRGTDTTYSAWYIKIKSNKFSLQDTNHTFYCGQVPCIEVSGISDVISSVSWNFGQSYHDSLNITPYFDTSQIYEPDTVKFTNGCMAIHANAITLWTSLPIGNICWATVDDSNKHNIIVWDTTGNGHEGIDSLRFYYYNSGWHFLGEESFFVPDTDRFFVDTVNVGSNGPAASAKTYMILSVDKCKDLGLINNLKTTPQSGEGGFGPSHTTMNIIMSPPGTFSWGSAPYEIGGVDIASNAEYYLIRNDTLLADSASGVHQLTDLSYEPTARYYVGIRILNQDMCPLTTKAFGHRVQKILFTAVSHSNVLINGKSLSLRNIETQISAKVYPNPFVNIINVDVTQRSLVEILDVTGRKIFSTIAETGHNIFTVNVADGIYFVQVNGSVIQKMVK